MLYITSTLSGKKELFVPSQKDKVSLYVCGITPYSPSHLGHGRCYVSFDILYRLLSFLGYQVVYCRNFTDIDDKLLNKAKELFHDQRRYSEVADNNIIAYHHEMRQLNCIAPTYEPRVTHHIPQIIDFIEQLIAQGHAYATQGDVYFHVKSFPGYGKLSKQKIEDLKMGVRHEIRADKKDPLDFALWKNESEGMFWKSPWGWGRPGWHIECSALALLYLGKQIDIHAGGLDLIFPHHENEIAQSESLLFDVFARYWLHNGLISFNHEKMSKSLGNILTLQDTFNTIDPLELRYYFLTYHYRAPFEFSWKTIHAIQKSYQRLINAFSGIKAEKIEYNTVNKFPVLQKMIHFLCDDMNTPGMLGVLFEHLSSISSQELSHIRFLLTEIIGLTLQPIQSYSKKPINPEIEMLIKERELARQKKDWNRADEIRKQLKQLDYEPHDQKS